MFHRLMIIAENQSDTRFDLDALNFPPRTLISVEEVVTSMPLIKYVPNQVTDRGLYKTFLYGLSDVATAVENVLRSRSFYGQGRLPTLRRVMEQLQRFWPPSYRTYFAKGGTIDHVLHGIVEMAKEQYIKGTYTEEENLPVIKMLDDDFHYVDTIVMSYLITN